ncbi:MAG TPA: stage II sporulation protein E, partial [Clostridiaceae bacterium]|nr:stage II sporulation protein E [Clostridiaceae bacterium]
KYLEAGFDKSTALKAINSAMVLRSQDDEYATIDLAVADLYTGDIEFIKIGAVSTFIKRENGTIETINSTTLPIGILNDVDLEIKKERLSDGDFVIMMTDGVLDVGGKVDTEWVIGILEEIKSKNPQEIANMIIEKAKERNKGGIPDDMTVMVSKIWQAL